MNKKSETEKHQTAQRKRAYISQTEIPRLTLLDTLRLAQSLYDNFASKPTPPHQIAMALEISPTSSGWQDLCGASIAYGLTSGGKNAQVIALTDLGRRVVSPTEEGDDVIAKVECALRPEIAKSFYERYNRSKFPQDRIARNVLAEMGVPADRLDNVFEIIKQNGEFIGIIHQTKTGPFVAIDTPQPTEESPEESTEPQEEVEILEASKAKKIQNEIPTNLPNQRVFITHGNNKEIVAQLKDLLVFGKFIPVVAEEHETTSKPVPDKVLEDMRSCFAGVIHVTNFAL